MLRHQVSRSSGFERIVFPNLPSQTSITALLRFLKICLLEFPTANLPQREDEVSVRLNRFFQEKAKENNLIFNFNQAKGVDFLLFVTPFNPNAKPVFVIEAKRLPPTNSKDYVQCRPDKERCTGGIERFKREQDGFDQNLSDSAMLGYVQKQDFTHWHTKINEWINGLINDRQQVTHWDAQDRLVQHADHSPQLGRYTSLHARKTLNTLKLHHFWLNLC